jgi:monoamine oxidase
MTTDRATRVIVVGAGMAGISAARAIADAGVECVVLEARDRIGGRLHTVDVGGSPVDLGGSWVHTPIGNPLTEVAARHGVALVPGSFLDDAVIWDDGPVGEAEAERLQRALGEDFPAWVETAELDLRTSAAEGIARFVAAQDVSGAARDRLLAHLRAFAEAEASGPAEDASLLAAAAVEEYEGDPIGDLPVGGYRELVSRIAAPLDIRLGTEVTGVEHGPAGVVVRTAAGAAEPGTHAIVTVPLGVLKAQALRFDPPLPAERLSAIDRLGFGRFEKLVLRFGTPFWSEAGLPHVFTLDTAGRQGISLLLGLDRFGVGPVLVAFGFGTGAGAVSDGSEDEAVARVLVLLERILDSPPPQPVATARSAWADDPFARGAYTYVAVGAAPADLDLLAAPVGERLLFAGEHTTSARVGYADGAMATGLREAARVLRR